MSNSISSLSFSWIAFFDNGETINQFDETGEHKFKEVQEKITNLAYFNLTNHKGKFFTVDLINGRIGYNYSPLPYLEKIEKENIRLVFFRRHKVEISGKGKELSHNIEYHLGLQWNDKKGNNHKIILQIDEQGNWLIGE
jgi:hypothetical protein